MCSLSVLAKAREWARYPSLVVVMIDFDGSELRIPCLLRNLSMILMGGSLLLSGMVQRYLVVASIMVRNPMWPLRLFFKLVVAFAF